MDPLRKGALAVCARLREAGHRALLAGGCVRDTLLGVAPKDYDIATSARPEDVIALFPRSVPVGVAFGVVRVLDDDRVYEVATFRHDGPYLDGRHPSNVTFSSEEEDAQRRDFTINALFYDPEHDRVVDYVNGQEDLRAGIVRTVGDPDRRFGEDYLRLVRAVRFAARLGYTIEDETAAAIRRNAHRILHTSAERLRDELVKMLCEGAPRRAFELMDALGLLEHLAPEVTAMHGVEQPPEYHPEGDVFIHTMMVIEGLVSPTPTLALGALLHDAGKPRTQTFEDRIRFNHHDKVGAAMADDLCKRLKFSNDTRERVVWLVEQHMRFATLPEMRESKRKRFVRTPGFDELMELHRLDCLASHGDLAIHKWVRDYVDNLAPETVAPPPLVTGQDLIAAGYTPGPTFKEILTTVEDEQLEGRLASKDEALDFIGAHWNPKDSN